MRVVLSQFLLCNLLLQGHILQALNLIQLSHNILFPYQKAQFAQKLFPFLIKRDTQRSFQTLFHLHKQLTQLRHIKRDIQFQHPLFRYICVFGIGVGLFQLVEGN